MDQGQDAAFAGTLDRPPTSTWEIINPREYEKHHLPAVPLLPDIHPLVDKQYRPYDIGQVGQLDVHILAGIFGGEAAARDLTPAWDGGIYWAGQLRNASPAEQATTKSIGLFYLSAWKSTTSAQAFAALYASELGRKYSGLKKDTAAESSAGSNDAADEHVYSTNEGPVVITTRGKLVFISESFDLELARKLTSLILDAQGSGEMRLAGAGSRGFTGGAHLQRVSAERFGANESRSRDAAMAPAAPDEQLTGSLVRFLSNCGMMKAVVDAAFEALK
jgi:hypothetical protein